MDARRPLAFEDQSFGLVNGRFLASFLDQACWPCLITECKRVLTPGGILRLTECEVGISNCPALQRLNNALYQALRKQGRTMLLDMLQDDFTCVSFGLIAWGKLPAS